MALINCPECGREVSDQAQACLHCGFPLVKGGPERYALILVSLNSDYSGNISAVQEALKIDDYTAAKALVDAAPAVLRRGMTYDDCQTLALRFLPKANVKMVQDQGEPDGELISKSWIPIVGPGEPKPPLGFGDTVAAVALGVLAAGLILSFLLALF